MQVSAVSQRSSTDGRHTWLAGAKPQDCVQHAELDGSQRAFGASLHSLVQHADPFGPASHSSPGSRMPFPHCSVLSVAR